MVVRVCSFGAVLACVLFAATPSLAAPSATSENTAQSLASEAENALEHKEYAKAAERFERAEARAHSPVFLVGWARALAGLGDLAKAYRKYNQVLREGVHSKAPRTWHGALVTAKAEADKLRPQLGWLTITVTGPEAPQVTLDGEPLPDAELGTRMPANPGRRSIWATAPGFVSAERTVQLAAGGVERVDIILDSDKSAVIRGSGRLTAPQAAKSSAAAPETGAASTDEGNRSRRVLTYVSLGIGSVGLVTGGVFGGLALKKRADLQDACGTDRRCPGSEESTLDEYHTLGTISAVGFGFAIAGLGTGITLLITEPAKDERKAYGFQCTPYVGLGRVGARGRF